MEYQYSGQYSYKSVHVPEYLTMSTSTNTSTITLELACMSIVRVPKIQYSSTASTCSKYEYP